MTLRVSLTGGTEDNPVDYEQAVPGTGPGGYDSEGVHTYGKARVLCINPCLPSVTLPPVLLTGLKMPGFGTKIKPMVGAKFKGGCDGCELVFDFMVQIEPFMLSLAFPLCLLTCLMKLVYTKKMPYTLPGKDRKDYPSFLGTLNAFFAAPLSPSTEVLTDITDTAEIAGIECLKCFTGWSIGNFCALLRDLTDIIVGILKCLISLLTKLAVINLRIAGLEGNPNVSIRKSAKCLKGFMATQTDVMAIQLNAIAELFKVLSIFFEFAGYPLPEELLSPSIDLSALAKRGQLDQLTSRLQAVVNLFGEPGKNNGLRKNLAWCAENIP